MVVKTTIERVRVLELNEVAPPGWGHTKAEKEKTKPDKPKSKIGGTAAAFKRALDDGRFKGLPGDKTKKEKTASMFKLMYSMKKKGAKPHYKPGTDEKYKKYQEDWKPEIEHSKLGDAVKKKREKKRKEAESSLPPHLKLDAMKKAFAHTNEQNELAGKWKIDSSAHKKVQKKAKLRNLAKGNTNPNEKAAAEKKAGGPKLYGEAKVDQGRSDYGKASIRNYRRSGPGHGEPAMFDPENKRGKLIDKRREEHKARRGVKGAKVPAYKTEEVVAEADKKGKGSGTKDACYHKVKASAKVWPSAYASGRLVQCRKKGAANYGNSKKESYSWRDDFDYIQEGAAWTKKEGKKESGGLNEKGRKSYERENPGSDLKAPQPEGGPRKNSFCARMSGVKGPMKDEKGRPTRKALALKKWKCGKSEDWKPFGKFIIDSVQSKESFYGSQEKVSNESNKEVEQTETLTAEATRYAKETGTHVKGGTKKPTSPKTKDAALDFIKNKYKGQIMRSGSNQQKKVKGAKSTVGTNKYKNAADAKKQTASDAKKRGFKSTQNYVDTMARYGGKKNYDKGRGLGT